MCPQADELIDTNEFIDGEWGDPQTVSFNQRDLLLYAVGIGCTEMKFICESPRAHAQSRIATMLKELLNLTYPTAAYQTNRTRNLPRFRFTQSPSA